MTGPPDATSGFTRLRALLLAALLAVFLVHVLNYLYFFVDDEGIPFIFARHLVEGKGFVYNSLEGRVEGYSDFLQVLLAAAWVLIVRGLGWAPVAVFFIGKAVSIASGVGTVALVWKALSNDHSIRLPGLVAGMGFLVLAPPLATWSCSSLEMASVALLGAIITVNLFEGSGTRDTLTALAACLLMLLRIDGFVYVFALLAPAWGFASAERRRDLRRRVLVPLVIAGLVYHAWRLWYFGDLLPCPLAAKVLYKFHHVRNIVTHPPDIPYALAFLRMYGVVPAIAGALLLIVVLARKPRAWPLLGSAGLLACYATLVGDWMIGFRFFLVLLPVTAILFAMAISSIPTRRLAWPIAVIACGWFATVTVRAATAYDHLEYLESWLVHPSLDPDRYFGRYSRLYEDIRGLVPTGSLIAYNQAGFVPYMLGVDNIEDLGVCTRFIAKMPTTDVVFTEVGRYSPLTDTTALRAANAYLLYRAPDFVIVPLDNIRSANLGSVPAEILRGHYAGALTDRHGQAVVYRRTREPLTEFQTTPDVFLENLAHPSRITEAFDGEIVPPGEYLSRLAFLAEGNLDRSFSGHIAYDIVFAKADLPVHEIDLQGVWARTDVTQVLSLSNAEGRLAWRDERVLAGNRPDHVSVSWPKGIAACRLSLAFDTRGQSSTRVTLHDLRVQGQSAALAAHVRTLAFPPVALRP